MSDAAHPVDPADRADPAYLQPYRHAVERFGPGFRATLWGSEEAQHLRFDIMMMLAAFDECTILDAGCGTGDFAARLLQLEVPFARYIGMDALEPVIATAVQRGLPRCEFRVADFVTNPEVMREAEPDFVCLSGTLNTMDEDTARGLISAAFDVAAQGVVFNFLSDRHHPKWNNRNLGPAHRFDTMAWLDWAFQKSCRVSFTQDYLDGHDATIMIRHE